MIYDKQMCVSYYKEKYPYFDIIDLEIMYDSCYEILLKTKYSSNYSVKEIPINVLERYGTWCLRAMKDWIDKNGLTNVLSYTENNVSMTFDKTGLSQSLLDEITPFAYMR